MYDKQILSKLEEWSKQFVPLKREGDTHAKTYKTIGDCDTFLKDAIRDIHEYFDRLPNDYIYTSIKDCLDCASEYEIIANWTCDCYVNVESHYGKLAVFYSENVGLVQHAEHILNEVHKREFSSIADSLMNCQNLINHEICSFMQNAAYRRLDEDGDL